MFKKISKFFKDFMDTSPRDASIPYNPVPPSSTENIEEPSNGQAYNEKNADIESIADTNIHFGTTGEMAVDAAGNVNNIKRKVGHLLGTGRLVTHIEPSVKDGINLPGIGGVCGDCQIEAAEMLRCGLIDIQEAQRQSLFDSDSGAQCGACGRKNLCSRHCRPFEIDSKSFNLCPDCTKAAKREKDFKMSVNVLLSIVTDLKKLPPPPEGK
jgi:hypothetical protein